MPGKVKENLHTDIFKVPGETGTLLSQTRQGVSYSHPFACRDSRRLLPRPAPRADHRCQDPLGFADGRAVREEIKDIVPDDNDVGALSIPRCGSAAHRPGEIILQAHRCSA